jgi:hypothetical protein
VDILVLSIISLITTLIGLYFLGEKKASGFLVFTASLLCQMYIFHSQSNWFLFFQMAVLIIFNVVNYRKWVRGT